MVSKFVRNVTESDVVIEFDSQPQVFRAEAVTELTYDSEERAVNMVEHFVKNGAGNLKEVSRDEAKALTGGAVGRPVVKSAKVKSSAPAGTEDSKEAEPEVEPETGEAEEEAAEETKAKPKGKGK